MKNVILTYNVSVYDVYFNILTNLVNDIFCLQYNIDRKSDSTKIIMFI